MNIFTLYIAALTELLTLNLNAKRAAIFAEDKQNEIFRGLELGAYGKDGQDIDVIIHFLKVDLESMRGNLKRGVSELVVKAIEDIKQLELDKIKAAEAVEATTEKQAIARYKRNVMLTNSISSGTLCTCIDNAGIVFNQDHRTEYSYQEIVRGAWLAFICEQGMTFAIWQDAWNYYVEHFTAIENERVQLNTCAKVEAETSNNYTVACTKKQNTTPKVNVKSVALCGNKRTLPKSSINNFKRSTGRKTFMQEYRHFSKELQESDDFDSATRTDYRIKIRFGDGAKAQGIDRMYSFDRFGTSFTKKKVYMHKLIVIRVHLLSQGIDYQDVNKQLIDYRKMCGAWNK